MDTTIRNTPHWIKHSHSNIWEFKSGIFRIEIVEHCSVWTVAILATSEDDPSFNYNEYCFIAAAGSTDFDKALDKGLEMLESNNVSSDRKTQLETIYGKKKDTQAGV